MTLISLALENPVAAAPSTGVPTLGEWGLLALGALLASLSLWVISRRPSVPVRSR